MTERPWPGGQVLKKAKALVSTAPTRASEGLREPPERRP